MPSLPNAKRRRALLLGATALASLATAGPAAAARYALAVTPVADPLLADLQVPADAPQAGMWGPLQIWPMVAIHAALLPSGNVLTYGTPQGTGVQDGRSYDVWNPYQGFQAGHTVLPGLTTVNSFCAAQALRPDGTLLISGGILEGGQDKGSAVVNAAATAVSALSATLADDRYYASMITQADGSQLILGGDYPYAAGWSDPQGSIANGWNTGMTPEVLRPATGWTSLFGAKSEDAFGPDNSRYWYPRAWSAPDGKTFGISSDNLWSLDASGSGRITVSHFKAPPTPVAAPGPGAPNTGPASTAAMYDRGKVLQVGGNSMTNFNGLYPASSAATLFDLTGKTATFRDTAPMTFPRAFATATVLPTGKVAVTGGSRQGDSAGSSAVRAVETFDPATARWTVGPLEADYRGYHSNAILLQDGTVMVAGGGVPGPDTNFTAQLYYPPYLFTASGGRAKLADRPQLLSLNAAAFNFGAPMQIEMSAPGAIASLVLVGLSETTHGFNSGQRRYPLGFTQNGALLSAKAPASGAEAPPGYYQLVAIDAKGVPSPGVIVAVGNGVKAPPTTAAPVAGRATATAVPTPASAVAAPANGAWSQLGGSALRVAAGYDGTTVMISSDNTVWRYRADNDWVRLPSKMQDVAVRSAGSIWGIGLDRGIYRLTGSSWTRVPGVAVSISVSADGVVATTNVNNEVWYKPSDDTKPNWSKLPVWFAKRIAVMNARSLYFIGLDDNVYRTDFNGNGAQIGLTAAAIAASADGTLEVSDLKTHAIWQKVGDDDGNGWTLLPRKPVLSLAVPGSGRTLAVGMDNGVWRN